MSQPNLLKPSDLTKPLLKSPSNYYGNETKQPACYSSVDEHNSRYMQLASTTRSREGIIIVINKYNIKHYKLWLLGIVHKDSHGSVQTVMPDYHTIDEVINPNDKTSVEPCGMIESADQKDVLDSNIPKLQMNSEESCEVLLPPHDILKQLILPDSKIKQNQKLLKEFRERHFQMEKCCIIETGTNLLLHNQTTHNDVSTQDCSSPTLTQAIFAVNENIDQSHGDEIIPTGCNDPLNDVNRTNFSQPTRQVL